MVHGWFSYGSRRVVRWREVSKNGVESARAHHRRAGLCGGANWTNPSPLVAAGPRVSAAWGAGWCSKRRGNSFAKRNDAHPAAPQQPAGPAYLRASHVVCRTWCVVATFSFFFCFAQPPSADGVHEPCVIGDCFALDEYEYVTIHSPPPPPPPSHLVHRSIHCSIHWSIGPFVRGNPF